MWKANWEGSDSQRRGALSDVAVDDFGATGYFVEYAGSVVRNLSMEGRLTLCNLSIEMGARGGFIARTR